LELSLGVTPYLFADGEWICYNTRSWDDAFMEKGEIPAGSINDKN